MSKEKLKEAQKNLGNRAGLAIIVFFVIACAGCCRCSSADQLGDRVFERFWNRCVPTIPSYSVPLKDNHTSQ